MTAWDWLSVTTQASILTSYKDNKVPSLLRKVQRFTLFEHHIFYYNKTLQTVVFKSYKNELNLVKKHQKNV